MYKCNCCKETFYEPDVERYEEYREFWGMPCSETFYEATCPRCGSSDIEEYYEGYSDEEEDEEEDELC